ncbi:MAG: spiro-SPASM protein [Leptonema sp. (in: bacteria)]
MYLQSLLKNRTIDFCIIYSNLKSYKEELIFVFLEKIKILLESLQGYEFRKKLFLKIPENFKIYFVSHKEENLVSLKTIKKEGFEFHFLIAHSLKECIEKIDTIKMITTNEETEINELGDSFLYFPAIAPLLDINKSKELILQHFVYLAEYTYCDIAVPGFLPILCNINLAKRIVINDNKYSWEWSEFLLKNSQTVDLEIFYLEKDYRIFRLRYDLFNERSHKICENLFKENKKIPYNDLEIYLKEKIFLFRIAPSWIEIELTNKQLLNPKIYPNLQDKNENFLSLEIFKKIIKDLEEFELKNSMTLCLGGMGEIFFHPYWEEILDIAIRSELFSKIYLETFFYEVNFKDLKVLDFFKDAIELIIKLPTLNEKLYEDLMGKNFLPTIKENLQKLPQGLKVYAEILRIQQVEEELDSYFEFFKNTSIVPIIGKYNSYGILADYKAVDLEPFEKDYCRNLMFSLYINCEGKIPICRQDIFCKYKTYDLKELSIKKIFFDLEKMYNHFINKEYESILPICRNCSEWYVFLG